ncbi:MAG: NAD/NADP-dependent betaine aldehyde dehydrogenase [Steroidobacteraceae bacterium]|nr:NAD/NADP-dependent betaine aldehyde dehydrogenase [Steroidobacteraceae bacterium]
MDAYRMFIDGEHVDAIGGNSQTLVDPGTGAAFAQVPSGDERDVDLAVRAARAAFDGGAWSALAPAERARILIRWADLIEAHSGRIALADSRSMGGTPAWVGGGLWVAANSIRNLAWYAAHKFAWEEEIPVSGSVYAYGANVIRREPIGVVAAIAPWNVPYMMALWKIVHALVTGNTVVLKPASSTPLSALIVAELANQAGIPRGVLNVVTGPGGAVGESLCVHPLVDKISLTGSSEVGKRIMALAAQSLKRVSLELGGKSASIVCDDADIDIAVDGAIAGNFANCGQICISASRLLVARPIYAEVLERLERRIRDVKVGYQLLPDTKIGPLATARQLETVRNYVGIGKAEGARLVCGGKRLTVPGFEGGFYFEPTIFADVDNGMRIAREEILGPVLVVLPFDTDDEAVAIANDSDYGLAGAVWSRDPLRARNIANRIQTGTMWINDVAVLSDFAPFGGYKSSGIGREFGDEGLKSYTQSKVIYTSNEATANRATFKSLLSYPPNPSFAFCQPTKVVCGPGSIAGLENELRLLGARRAVIVTDPGLKAAGIVDEVRRAGGSRIVGVFDGVVADPTYECVDAALACCRAAGADAIVSLGGGSSIDTAKLALVALSNGGSAIENMGLMRLEGPLLPHVAIPTTHGTGSEVTLGAVITNAELHRKFFVADFHLIPKVAILDATLTTGLPRSISIGTGLDALTHAIEGLATPGANPITTATGLQSVRMIAQHLPRVLADGRDLEARQGMLVASLLAGITLGPGLGIAHAFAHTVGTLFGVHHGTGCGIGLLPAMNFNRAHATAPLARVAQALGVDTRGLTDLQAADAAVDAVSALMKGIGAPMRLGDLGLTGEQAQARLPDIIAGTMSDLNGSTNPRPVTDPNAVAELVMATI